LQERLSHSCVLNGRWRRSVAIRENNEAGAYTAQHGKGAHTNPEAHEVGFDEMALIMQWGQAVVISEDPRTELACLINHAILMHHVHTGDREET
jgi:hypothetical protein